MDGSSILITVLIFFELVCVSIDYGTELQASENDYHFCQFDGKRCVCDGYGFDVKGQRIRFRDVHWRQIDAYSLSKVEKFHFYRSVYGCMKIRLECTVRKCIQDINDVKIPSTYDPKKHTELFLTAQKYWEKYLESEAISLDYDFYGGSAAEIFIFHYLINKTEERILELKDRFDIDTGHKNLNFQKYFK